VEALEVQTNVRWIAFRVELDGPLCSEQGGESCPQPQINRLGQLRVGPYVREAERFAGPERASVDQVEER
jgi:hypothetical protein